MAIHRHSPGSPCVKRASVAIAGLATESFRREVIAGLTATPRTLPCKYLYDDVGSQLFEMICDLPEYYLTRAELEIMQNNASEMASAIGPEALIIEYGSGASVKTPLLLRHLSRPAGYVPVDISREHLFRSAAVLSARFRDIKVTPVCADFTRYFPVPHVESSRTIVYFPGSTIGNFSPDHTRELLKQVQSQVGLGGGLLIGVDMKKPSHILEAAYNDSQGVTATFNSNLLRRINRELQGDFVLDKFLHRAFFNDEHSRIEMHLVSQASQSVAIGTDVFHFEAGDTIHTENSYKFTLETLSNLMEDAGFVLRHLWMDHNKLFCVCWLESVL